MRRHNFNIDVIIYSCRMRSVKKLVLIKTCNLTTIPSTITNRNLELEEIQEMYKKLRSMLNF